MLANHQMAGLVPSIMAYCLACGEVHRLHGFIANGGYICRKDGKSGGGFILFSYGYVGYKNRLPETCRCSRYHYVFDEQGEECRRCHLLVLIRHYDEYMPGVLRRMCCEAEDGRHSQELESTFPEKFGEILAEAKAVRSKALTTHLPPVPTGIVLAYFGAVKIVPT